MFGAEIIAEKESYLYGPVPSRRLGCSLGVDIIPFKICSFDCIYCQLGETSQKTVERKEYSPVDDILAEIKGRIATGLNADFITITGSGEPTLHSRLGLLITSIKSITDIPVAVLTNGALFFRQDVRADCAKADVVLPSLDAADEPTFKKINRPHKDISIANVISGLSAFRNEYAGQIWLEIFLLENVNTAAAHIANLKNAIKLIRPDKVHLNTAVRPTAVPGIKKLDEKTLQTIARQLGKNCEVIADFSREHFGKHAETMTEHLLSILKRRPCSLDDISTALGIPADEALDSIGRLQRLGMVTSSEKNGVTFFIANRP